ncbi:hypothetical protein OROMI_014118 [Orobanche minor]
MLRKHGSRVLYVGNVCGLTVSNLSDLVGSDGLVYAVGFSDDDDDNDDVDMAGTRPNVVVTIRGGGKCSQRSVNDNSTGHVKDPFTRYDRRKEFEPIETVMLDGADALSVGGYRI